MSSAAWSIVTAVVSVAGLWLSGYNPRWGWVYGIGAQAVWLVAGLATGRPGDIGLSLVFTVIYARNLRRWRGTRFERASESAAEPAVAGRELCCTGAGR